MSANRMRASTSRKIIGATLVLCVLIWVVYYHHGHISSFGIEQKEVNHNYPELINERVKKISTMLKENKEILDKLQDDMTKQKTILLNKIRQEIPEENVRNDKAVIVFGTRFTNVWRADALTMLAEEYDLNKGPVVQPKIITSPTAPVVSKALLPVVITACNRPSVARCLNKLMEIRGAKADQFPILVSQDCGDKATERVLNGYGDKITFVQHSAEPLPKNAMRGLEGYYKISMHYKFAISQGFSHFPKSDAIIIVEDDIEISPDFFSYFLAMHELLKKDPTLWCASAWNDNGKTSQIDVSKAGAEILYRSDFFPGLGWLLKRSLWEDELSSKWPAGFWDDWMRQPEQRKGRACIRPEISRTSTFGRKGVSQGQFFDSHLKFIKLNEFNVNWSKKNLDYLLKDKYDKEFLDKVYSLPSIRTSELLNNEKADQREVRIEYSMLTSFKAFSKELGLMTDLKKGVPRTAYKGIISTLYRGRRVYLAPPRDWKGYDETWE